MRIFLVILTAVDNVYINFGKPDQIALEEIKVEDLKPYLNDDHFAKGSMYPKLWLALISLVNLVKKQSYHR